MTQGTNVRKLFSAALVGLAVVGWIVVNKYTTPASPGTSSSLSLHWIAVGLYLGVIFGTILAGLVIAFWGHIDRTKLLIRAWNFVISIGLLILYFITSDPLALSGLKQIGLGGLQWIFLISGIVSLVSSFLLLGSIVDARNG